MWNCNWGYHQGPWNWFPGHTMFGTLFSLLLFVSVVALIIYGVRSMTGRNYSHDRRDSLEILKIKYADGKITKEEFQRMRDILEN